VKKAACWRLNSPLALDIDDAELGPVDNNESRTGKKANQSGVCKEKVIWPTTGEKLSNSIRDGS
jgi:hypothetical protein